MVTTRIQRVQVPARAAARDEPGQTAAARRVGSSGPAGWEVGAWDWESARERAERRYGDYYSLPGATKPARGES
jgi:hypothetical protein